MTAIEELCSVASRSLSDASPRFEAVHADVIGAKLPGLIDLLTHRNGFFAFESALHVFHASEVGIASGVGDWNDPGGWRSYFGDMTRGLVFFAEDLFGNQFGISGQGIFRFDPETSERIAIATDVEAWAKLILEKADIETGWHLGHAWQLQNGALWPTCRLVPTLPFILGGEFEVANLRSVERRMAMEFYANIANQLARLPDGTKVKLRITE